MADPGADRRFVEDPTRAGLGDIVGDQTAMMQQILALMGGLVAADPAAAARVAALQAHAGVAREATEALSVKESSQRMPPPLTRIPQEEWGDHALENIKYSHITKFTGEESDINLVYLWLNAVVDLAEANELSFAAATHLLSNTASKCAAVTIADCRAEGMDFPMIVHELEVRYGSLMTPREALRKLTTISRPPGQAIDRFVNDLKRFAKLAVRQETDEGVRRTRYTELVKGAIIRTATRWTRKAIELKEGAIFAAHAREMTITEMEVEIRKAESEAAEYNAQQNKSTSGKPQYKGYRGRAQAVALSSAVSESEDEPEEEQLQAAAVVETSGDPYLDYMVQQVMDKKKVARGKGRQPASKEKVFASAARRFNKQFASPDAANVAEVEHRQQRGPPLRTTERGKAIEELLALANVSHGECILCGMKGHIKSHHSCPLRGKRITDRPCIQCGRGLHDASDCILSHIDPRQQINDVDEDDDDSLNIE